MANIRQITDWRAPTKIGLSYDKLLAAIGTPEFGATVRDSVLSMTAGARRVYLFEATSRESSTLQYSFCEPEVAELFPAYTRWYLRRDPVGDAFDATPHHCDVALQRVRPSDIATPSFRRVFFDDAGIVERISVIQRGHDAWRGINIARHASDGTCSDDDAIPWSIHVLTVTASAGSAKCQAISSRCLPAWTVTGRSRSSSGRSRPSSSAWPSTWPPTSGLPPRPR